MALGELLNKTGRDFKKNFKAIFWSAILFVGLPSLIVTLVLYATGGMVDPEAINWPQISLLIVFGLASLFFWLVATSGIVKASVRKEKFNLRDIWSYGKENWVRYLGFNIVFGIFLIGLFILLIIPGVIFAVYWALSSYVLFDEEKGIRYSLKKSKKMIKGNWWRVFGYVLLTLLAYLIFDGVLSLLGVFTTDSISLFISDLLVSIFVSGFVILFYKNLYMELKGNTEDKPKARSKKKKA